MEILEVIDSIYQRGELAYILRKYVDRNFWNEKLIEYFCNNHIDNATEFNYNKCFTFYINLSDINASIGSKEFDDFITENKNLYVLILHISVLAPFCIVKYGRYYVAKGEINNVVSNSPFLPEHFEFNKKINEFVSSFKLTLLDDDLLMTEVPGKSLELREAPVSAYNCLFEDTYTYYPYSKRVID